MKAVGATGCALCFLLLVTVPYVAASNVHKLKTAPKPQLNHQTTNVTHHDAKAQKQAVVTCNQYISFATPSCQGLPCNPTLSSSTDLLVVKAKFSTGTELPTFNLNSWYLDLGAFFYNNSKGMFSWRYVDVHDGTLTLRFTQAELLSCLDATPTSEFDNKYYLAILNEALALALGRGQSPDLYQAWAVHIPEQTVRAPSKKTIKLGRGLVISGLLNNWRRTTVEWGYLLGMKSGGLHRPQSGAHRWANINNGDTLNAMADLDLATYDPVVHYPVHQKAQVSGWLTQGIDYIRTTTGWTGSLFAHNTYYRSNRVIGVHLATVGQQSWWLQYSKDDRLNPGVSVYLITGSYSSYPFFPPYLLVDTTAATDSCAGCDSGVCPSVICDIKYTTVTATNGPYTNGFFTLTVGAPQENADDEAFVPVTVTIAPNKCPLNQYSGAMCTTQCPGEAVPCNNKGTCTAGMCTCDTKTDELFAGDACLETTLCDWDQVGVPAGINTDKLSSYADSGTGMRQAEISTDFTIQGRKSRISSVSFLGKFATAQPHVPAKVDVIIYSDNSGKPGAQLVKATAATAEISLQTPNYIGDSIITITFGDASPIRSYWFTPADNNMNTYWISILPWENWGHSPASQHVNLNDKMWTGTQWADAAQDARVYIGFSDCMEYFKPKPNMRTLVFSANFQDVTMDTFAPGTLYATGRGGVLTDWLTDTSQGAFTLTVTIIPAPIVINKPLIGPTGVVTAADFADVTKRTAVWSAIKTTVLEQVRKTTNPFVAGKLIDPDDFDFYIGLIPNAPNSDVNWIHRPKSFVKDMWVMHPRMAHVAAQQRAIGELLMLPSGMYLRPETKPSVNIRQNLIYNPRAELPIAFPWNGDLGWTQGTNPANLQFVPPARTTAVLYQDVFIRYYAVGTKFAFKYSVLTSHTSVFTFAFWELKSTDGGLGEPSRVSVAPTAKYIADRVSMPSATGHFTDMPTLSYTKESADVWWLRIHFLVNGGAGNAEVFLDNLDLSITWAAAGTGDQLRIPEGNTLDVMGWSQLASNFISPGNVQHLAELNVRDKTDLGFLAAPANVQMVDMSGSYRLYSHDTSANTKVKALVLGLQGQTAFWLQYTYKAPVSVPQVHVLHESPTGHIIYLDATPDTKGCSGCNILDTVPCRSCDLSNIGIPDKSSLDLGYAIITIAGFGSEGAGANPYAEVLIQFSEEFLCPIAGTFGPQCDQHCPGGFMNPCSGHGKCTALGCLCDEGYTGDSCAKLVESQECDIDEWEPMFASSVASNVNTVPGGANYYRTALDSSGYSFDFTIDQPVRLAGVTFFGEFKFTCSTIATTGVPAVCPEGTINGATVNIYVDSVVAMVHKPGELVLSSEVDKQYITVYSANQIVEDYLKVVISLPDHLTVARETLWPSNLGAATTYWLEVLPKVDGAFNILTQTNDVSGYGDVHYGASNPTPHTWTPSAVGDVRFALSFSHCLKVYKHVEVPLPDTMRIAPWFDYTPKQIRAEVPTIFTLTGYIPYTQPIMVKVSNIELGYGCEGEAAGGEEQMLNELKQVTFTITKPGLYSFCIKLRNDWEEAFPPAPALLDVLPSDQTLNFHGYLDCAGVMASDPTVCGCMYTQPGATPADPYNTIVLPLNIPFEHITSGETPVRILQGCCTVEHDDPVSHQFLNANQLPYGLRKWTTCSKDMGMPDF